MLPKSGRKFRLGSLPTEAEYISAIQCALREEVGGAGAVTKTIMRWANASDRTARNWLSGTAGPSGYHLLGLVRESDAVLAVMLEMSGRAELMLSIDIHAAEVALAKASGALEILKRQRLDLSARLRKPPRV